jgi:ATP-dependent Clp protease adaptor protein ClpS
MASEKRSAEAVVKTSGYNLFKVLFHNDDKTTMEFVVAVLVEIFRKDQESAVKIMMEVHEKGIGLVAVEPYERAEFHRDQVVSLARPRGYPLAVSIEPA